MGDLPISLHVGEAVWLLALSAVLLLALDVGVFVLNRLLTRKGQQSNSDQHRFQAYEPRPVVWRLPVVLSLSYALVKVSVHVVRALPVPDVPYALIAPVQHVWFGWARVINNGLVLLFMLGVVALVMWAAVKMLRDD